MEVTWVEQKDGTLIRSDLVERLAKKRFKARKACLRKYGLTVADYDRMLKEQGGGCAICSKVYDVNPLAVDHDHQTGKVRALLCYRCNNLVGIFEKNEGLHLKVLEYLTKYGKAN